MSLDPQLARIMAAAVVLLLYAALCGATLRKRRRLQEDGGTAQGAMTASARPMLVAYASQTGFAEQVARQTARSLHAAGVPAQLASLSEISAGELRETDRALFVLSTYGQGDPPDNAALFARRTLSAAMSLSHLRYGMLALGDRTYADFCGFGRAVDRWLESQSARPLFARVEVDGGDERALHRWQDHIKRMAGVADLPDWRLNDFERCRLAARRCLNPGSAGNPCFHVELEPPAGEGPTDWQAGDLVQILAPGDSHRPREYSIASLPADGRIELLVREERRVDGSVGLASGWLTRGAAVGDLIELRLRVNSNFHLGANASRPLILIGNGTGLAGLRSHLKARIAAGEHRNWLIYGERSATHDFYYRDEIAAWQEQGVLARADLVFSRDQPRKRYVQDRLREAGATVREWLQAGAAMYVCGSLQGMAGGVDAALTEIAGEQTVERLRQAGRYRRDVY